MESGRYAGIIRLRIKRRQFSRQKHKSDSRNSKLASFVPAAATQLARATHTPHTCQENTQRSSISLRVSAVHAHERINACMNIWVQRVTGQWGGAEVYMMGGW